MSIPIVSGGGGNGVGGGVGGNPGSASRGNSRGGSREGSAGKDTSERLPAVPTAARSGSAGKGAGRSGSAGSDGGKKSAAGGAAVKPSPYAVVSAASRLKGSSVARRLSRVAVKKPPTSGDVSDTVSEASEV
mmetsp:Transcript_1753/g.3957  ORF Transcript_1753/g.3957 Transcript_1753/m.3957 type:complete len:132 (+) Transcript_1753:2-397(+)